MLLVNFLNNIFSFLRAPQIKLFSSDGYLKIWANKEKKLTSVNLGESAH